MRVLWSQLLLIDGQGSLIQRLGLLVLALCSVEVSQVVEAGGRVGVLWSQLLLIDGQGSLILRLGLLVLALCSVEVGQGRCISGRIEVLCSLLLFTDLKRLLEKGFCFIVANTFREIPPRLL